MQMFLIAGGWCLVCEWTWFRYRCIHVAAGLDIVDIDVHHVAACLDIVAHMLQLL
jgi:hypothetical protein